jgi:hypothetical protein
VTLFGSVRKQIPQLLRGLISVIGNLTIHSGANIPPELSSDVFVTGLIGSDVDVTGGLGSDITITGKLGSEIH